MNSYSGIDRARIANLSSDKIPIRMNWNSFGAKMWLQFEYENAKHSIVGWCDSCVNYYDIFSVPECEAKRQEKRRMKQKKTLIKEPKKPKNTETKRNGQKSMKRKNKFY